ncbi:Peptidoglycan/LPS O-acetylase OafA/YrhL, contains acyltransferase and SGNH-hydrolase domains [Bryocella elongata]|uniref:Peptidoglycan/LPS O-acetylase OafA/YrhL, contains acyltransferase and SGNH-hydrolase domains n=1 Tax=Bryocella elongata TaxID=863522 RepID=A0A1H5TV84_9BACT|nr:acyltransferase [Bryocella elongata]SEF66706.1 Peptidoglycan/LPS O-acetylase OafA/YrhL, contains acyltransferase and SGNH-hydrolase domains [Bryocella elongata]
MHNNGPRNWISRNYQSFDGLRAIAILMVFTIHYGDMVVPAKYVECLWTGVDLFFVLSGFLITGILWDSVDSPTYYRDFYTRRALRIFPLYYGFFLCVAVLTPLVHLRYDPMLWTNLLYLLNFTVAFAPQHNPSIVMIGHVIRTIQPTVGLGVLWSLCVEEHFYLLWPFVVRYARGRRRLLISICLMGIVCVMSLRMALYLHDPVRYRTSSFLYRASFTRFDTLLIGASLALLLREYRMALRQFRAIALGCIAFGMVTLATGLLTFGRTLPWDLFNPVFSTYGYTSVGIVAAGIVMLAIDENSALSRLLRNRYLKRIGVVSYGIYFLHALPMQFVDAICWKLAHWHAAVVVVPCTFLLTYFAAQWSYAHIESPFLRLKDRWAPPIAHVSRPSGVRDIGIAA